MSGLSSYIVAFKKESDAPHATDDHIASCCSKVESAGGSIKHKYESRTLRGFAGTLTEELKAEFEKNDAVKYVEPDGEVKTQ